MHAVCTSDSEPVPSPLVSALLALASQLTPADRVALTRLLLADSRSSEATE